ncbi:unnamed protein product [Acidithrix sp. C25]|nr:unnamed protein product [Acidithrix sp. C25]
MRPSTSKPINKSSFLIIDEIRVEKDGPKVLYHSATQLLHATLKYFSKKVWPRKARSPGQINNID